jgi:hypothetical protein
MPSGSTGRFRGSSLAGAVLLALRSDREEAYRGALRVSRLVSFQVPSRRTASTASMAAAYVMASA